jgi:hypothetical protein
MTIKIADVQTRARLLANDMGKTKYSDYELETALDAAVDMLCDSLKRYDSPELVRRTTLTLTDGSVALPDGLICVVFVEDGQGDEMMCSHYECSELPDHCYRIEGSNLLANEDSVLLAYMKDPTDSTAGTLDLSDGFLIYLAGMVSNLVKGEVDAASIKAENAAAISKGDKRGVIPDPPMWGGY